MPCASFPIVKANCRRPPPLFLDTSVTEFATTAFPRIPVRRTFIDYRPDDDERFTSEEVLSVSSAPASIGRGLRAALICACDDSDADAAANDVPTPSTGSVGCGSPCGGEQSTIVIGGPSNVTSSCGGEDTASINDASALPDVLCRVSMMLDHSVWASPRRASFEGFCNTPSPVGSSSPDLNCADNLCSILALDGDSDDRETRRVAWKELPSVNSGHLGRVTRDELPDEEDAASSGDDDDDSSDDDANCPRYYEGAHPPSIGSTSHGDGFCKRCCFFPKGRCNNGWDCQFCHFAHDKRKPKSRRKKKRRKRGSRGAQKNSISDCASGMKAGGTPSHASSPVAASMRSPVVRASGAAEELGLLLHPRTLSNEEALASGMAQARAPQAAQHLTTHTATTTYAVASFAQPVVIPGFFIHHPGQMVVFPQAPWLGEN